MTVRYVCSAIVAGLLSAGAVAIGVERTHAQEPVASALPNDDAMVTVVGCVQRGLEKRLVLVNPTIDHVASVPEPTCNTPVAEPLLELHDTHEYHLDDSFIGRWVEISGRLEHFDKHDDVKDPRELHVRTVRAVPVVPPRAAEIVTPPPPAPPRDMPLTPQPSTTPAPTIPEGNVVATTGTATALPPTASDLPLGLLTTVMLLMGALAVRLIRLRLEGQV
jgi:hypothetical protein